MGNFIVVCQAQRHLAACTVSISLLERELHIVCDIASVAQVGILWEVRLRC